MRKIKTAIVMDPVTFDAICSVVIVNENRTITQLTITPELTREFMNSRTPRPLQYINRVLKLNSLPPLTQEEIDFIKTPNLVEDFVKKEFSIEDLQKVAGIKE